MSDAGYDGDATPDLDVIGSLRKSLRLTRSRSKSPGALLSCNRLNESSLSETSDGQELGNTSMVLPESHNTSLATLESRQHNLTTTPNPTSSQDVTIGTQRHVMAIHNGLEDTASEGGVSFAPATALNTGATLGSATPFLGTQELVASLNMPMVVMEKQEEIGGEVVESSQNGNMIHGPQEASFGSLYSTVYKAVIVRREDMHEFQV